MSRYQSLERYDEARRKAIREDAIAWLKHQHADLLPYEAVAQVLKAYEYAVGEPELRTIPIDKIIGSVGRYRDFTRSFLPRKGVSPDRWAQVEAAADSMEGLPPIQVYQIGDVYFVADGNHRVSVARANDFDTIDAYVTRVPIDAGLEPGDDLDEAIIKAEAARFLAETSLGQRFPHLDIQFTRPGSYLRLLDHIEAHGHFMRIDHPERPKPTFAEAALHWYERVYLPVIAAIRDKRLVERCPGRTASDLYVWVSARILELAECYGQNVTPEQAIDSLAGQEPQPEEPEEPPSPLQRIVLALVDHLAAASETAYEPMGAESIAQGWAAAEALANGTE